MAIPESLRGRARALELLVLDVDGVLTDGVLRYGPEGEQTKDFHVRDGLGIKLLRGEGVEVGVISGRSCAALERRLADLGIEHRYLGREDKGAALDELLAAVGCAAGAASHVGDDLPDIPVFERLGFGIAVADAHPRTRAAADWVLETAGGAGAVREVTDALLDARGRLDAAVDAYLARARSHR